VFGVIAPFAYLFRKAEQLRADAAPPGDDEDDDVDYTVQRLEDIPHCEKPLLCVSSKKLQAQVDDRKRQLTVLRRRKKLRDAGVPWEEVDKLQPEPPVTTTAAAVAAAAAEAKNKKKQSKAAGSNAADVTVTVAARRAGNNESSSSDDDSDNEPEIPNILLRLNSYVMDGVTQRWVETKFIQRHAIGFETARLPHFATLDMIASIVLGFLSGMVDGNSDTQRCVAASTVAMAMMSLYLFLLLGAQLRGQPAWLTRYDTFCVWSNLLIALPTSVFAFLKLHSEAAVNPQDEIAAYLSAVGNGSSAVEALVAHDRAAASAVDVDAALDALSIVAALLGCLGVVAVVDVLVLFIEGVMMMVERCCAAANKNARESKRRRKSKSETKRQKQKQRERQRDLDEALLEAVSPRSRRSDAVVVDVASGNKPTKKTRRRRRQEVAESGGSQELAVRKTSATRKKRGPEDVEERGVLQVPMLSVSL
jgi:hypothetical protein